MNPLSRNELHRTIVALLAEFAVGLGLSSVSRANAATRAHALLMGPDALWAVYDSEVLTVDEFANKLLAEMESWAIAMAEASFSRSVDVARVERFRHELRAALEPPSVKTSG